MLQLRDDLHWCLCADRLVLLDLAADRYFCVPPSLEEPFLRAAEGSSIAGDREKLQVLVDRGMLIETTSERNALVSSRPSIPAPSADLFPVATKAGAADIVRALILDLWAGRQLRTKPLLAVARGAARRAGDVRTAAHDAEPRLRRAMSGFAALRLVVREADRCLVRALAVHFACCRQGVPARLVLGVQLHPFHAHAWVQLDDKILTGEFEQVRLFTPIAVLG